ncbi:hypothetical protein FE634_04140 [Nocardioides dongxiaopingii]|nr:hypothetical protein FE634_04140 [Nocardioides sp. S-1144]
MDGAGDDGNPGESYHGYSVDDEDQAQSTGDSLVDDDRVGPDPLDEGYSPPEKWSAAQRFGNTPWEEAQGEDLAQRVAQEEPEPDPYVEAEAIPIERLDVDDDTDALSTAGGRRAGRLVAPDEGVHEVTDRDEVAADVGIDGAGAGAEEAAMHVLDPVVSPVVDDVLTLDDVLAVDAVLAPEPELDDPA